MAVVAIASRWLSSLFMIQNSAALLFNLLYKHLSNKKMQRISSYQTFHSP